MPAPEAVLRDALDRLPRPATLWWRDDDAGRDHPALHRLLGLAAVRDVPVALAVVPAWLEGAAVEVILGCRQATVLQHGIAHEDHARTGEKKIELGGTADADGLRRDLAAGRERLAGAFGARFLPVLVPPWNRIDPALVPGLRAWGYRGLSRFGPARGPGEVNTHLDLMLWREDRRPLGFDELAPRLAAILHGVRDEPIGLLSHHLVAGGAGLAALDRLLAVLQDHPKALLAEPSGLFREAA